MRNRWIAISLLVVIAMALVVSPVAAAGPTNRVERAEVRFLEGMIDHHAMALDMAYDCLDKATTAAVRDTCQIVITDQTREIAIMRGWLLIWYGIDYQPMSMMAMQQGGMMQGGMMQGGMMGDMMGGMMQGGMMDGGMMQDPPADQPPAPGGEHDQHHPGGSAPAAPPAAAQPAAPMMDPQGMMGMMAWYHNHLTGVDFEIAWLEAMVDHHDDALHMAERILGVTERPELLAIAQDIIDAQTHEIEMMEGLIAELGG